MRRQKNNPECVSNMLLSNSVSSSSLCSKERLTFQLVQLCTETLILILSPGRVSCSMAKVRVAASEVYMKSMLGNMRKAKVKITVEASFECMLLLYRVA